MGMVQPYLQWRQEGIFAALGHSRQGPLHTSSPHQKLPPALTVAPARGHVC
jgi:hypothetical protein